MQKGAISVQAENIFPIIKKFLYSEHDIFLRELVANAIDATTKLKTLASCGEFTEEIGSDRIQILLDEKKKTLTIRDAGIGMTSEEVEKYLNQVAFSSAQEFLEKYQDTTGIIGHFGLGFYSAFMVADKVEVVTRSWKPDAEPVKWTCSGDPSYTLDKTKKTNRGTDVILHISDDSKEYLEKSKIEELLTKYCKFLPIEIQFGTKTKSEWEGEGENRKEIKEEVDNIINNTAPAWKKNPKDLKDEDYKAFYQELYPYHPEPLFWIHLNIDYPFNLTGILYFPKLTNSFEVQKNKIQLYCNQVYVTDEVKDILPEYLMLLHGVIDSPDIPLNVSRSYLQGDKNVKKINSYISKKVAERLTQLFKEDRAAFEQKWPDIAVFVKYGMLMDEKFFEETRKVTLLKNTEGTLTLLDEYVEKVKTTQTDKNERTIILYTHAAKEHGPQIHAAQQKGYDVILMDTVIDNHFIQHLESKLDKVSFARIDSGTLDELIKKEDNVESVLSADDQEKIKTLFKPVCEVDHAEVVLKAMSPNEMPVWIVRPEFMRRFRDMQSIQGGGMDMPEYFQCIVNSNHPMIAQNLLTQSEDQQKNTIQYLYRLAKVSQNMCKGEELTQFIQQSMDYLQKNPGTN